MQNFVCTNRVYTLSLTFFYLFRRRLFCVDIFVDMIHATTKATMLFILEWSGRDAIHGGCLPACQPD